MSNSLGDILDKSRFSQPAEVEIIQTFVLKKYAVKPSVTLQSNQIIIGVPSAALAGSLRMQLHHLAQICQTNKRLIIRIT